MGGSGRYTPEAIADYLQQGTVPVARAGLRGEALSGFEDLPVESYPWSAAAQRRNPTLPPGFSRAKWSRSRLVLSAQHGGEKIYVKRYVPIKASSQVSEAVLPPKLRREWSVSRQFLNAGVLTSIPLFYARHRNGNTYLATLSVPEQWEPLSERLKRGGIDREVLEALAEATRWLHDLPAYHHDYRADHIYLTNQEEDAPLSRRFAFIDVDGGFVGRNVSRSQRREAFFELFVSLGRLGLPRNLAKRLGSIYESAGPPVGLRYGRIWDEAMHDIHEAGPRRRARDKRLREFLKSVGIKRE